MKYTSAIYDALYNKLNGLRLMRDVPMKEHTTFHIGGDARLVLCPNGANDILKALDACKELGVDVHVMGNGSNMLIRDEGVEGLVIIIGEGMSGLSHEGNIFTAGAGMMLTVLARETIKAGYMGLEWASGIPGTVGGACAMNAGAHGGETAKFVHSIMAIEEGELKRFEVSPGDMVYRYSAYSAPERIVVSASFKLEPDDGNAHSRQQEYLSSRRDKQPLTQYSAGSTFKRPEGHYAGALIEGAGLKGVCVGGAMVSEKHAGFIVNTGNATCADVLALIEFVKERVYKEYGVMLEPEVKIL